MVIHTSGHKLAGPFPEIRELWMYFWLSESTNCRTAIAKLTISCLIQVFQSPPLEFIQVYKGGNVLLFTVTTWVWMRELWDWLQVLKFSKMAGGLCSVLLFDWNTAGYGNESLVERELYVLSGSSHNQYYPWKKTLSVEQCNQKAVQPCWLLPVFGKTKENWFHILLASLLPFNRCM